MKKSKHEGYSWPFLTPVDAVALGIPDYHQKITHAMDVSTISDKHKKGLYRNAADCKSDWDLMFNNCFTYNDSPLNIVHQLGKQYRKAFEEIWSTKKEWIRNNTEPSEPATPEPESEEEESSEDEIDPNAVKVAALQQQLEALQQQIAGTAQAPKKKPNVKQASSKKTATKATSKATAKPSKKVVAPQPTTKPKKEKSKPKPKPITQKQREEISARISALPNDEILVSGQIIKKSLQKAGKHDLAARAEEEMEFDMADLPEDALQKLFAQIRRVLGPPERNDPEFTAASPPAAPAAGKKKKRSGAETNKSKIEALQAKLNQFNNGSAPGAVSGGALDDSSEDDVESGSESEEE